LDILKEENMEEEQEVIRLEILTGRWQIQKDLMYNQTEAEEGVIITMEEEENKQMKMRVIIQEVDIRKEEEIDQTIIIED